jgi:thiaminase
MFEIYKDTQYNQNYRVVYYTELNEHNKHAEISRAMGGESLFNGFINEYKKEEAKKIIDEIIDRLNAGEEISPMEINNLLQEYIP